MNKEALRLLKSIALEEMGKITLKSGVSPSIDTDMHISKHTDREIIIVGTETETEGIEVKVSISRNHKYPMSKVK